MSLAYSVQQVCLLKGADHRSSAWGSRQKIVTFGAEQDFDITEITFRCKIEGAESIGKFTGFLFVLRPGRFVFTELFCFPMLDHDS
ncbi:MAG: hypothetical protein JWM68_2227 [Verrucomicrobiales bacterium]|nr:hypothetical protein [Verrucomicrobiales bacterium]